MNTDRINESYYGDVSDPMTERTRQRIHWICGQVTGQNVLDIGCSQGIVGLILGREGFNYVGIDIEADSIAAAQEALASEDAIVRQRVTFQLADGTNLPFPDDCFDTVILGEVLEHLTHPQKLLAEAKRVLRNNGRLIATVPFGLNAFHDHKCTYYPISLFELMQPVFRLGKIDTLNNYITYIGTRDDSYDATTLNKEGLLDEYVRWERCLEVRCLDYERSLLETRSKHAAQIKHLNAQLPNKDARIKELEEKLGSMKGQVRDVSAELEKAQHLAKAWAEERDSVATEKLRLSTELEAAKIKATADKQQIELLVSENTKLNFELAAIKTQFEEKIAKTEFQHTTHLRQREKYFQDLLSKQEADLNRKGVNGRIRELVRATLPNDANVLVVTRGDDDILSLDGRCASHFPQGAGGIYAGYHPKDSAEAITHLEALRAKGAQYLIIPAFSLWWLDFYGDFRQHLETNCRLMLYEERSCLIYALRPPSADQQIKCDIVMATNGVRKKMPAATQPPSSAPVSVSSSTKPTEKDIKPSRLTFGVILDEFTMGCFDPEARLVTFRPDNWRTTLERASIDALFVESAWRGNDGAWLYRVANYNRKMGDEFQELLEWTKRQSMPSIFWNKEDPVHFDRFIESARMFSHVFTTDADCIARYQQQLGHEHVFALPFAAQPAIHNPIQTEPRIGSVCFAGTYYGARHAERQTDMDFILRPAIPFGLEIYDRQHGLAGKGADDYRFPEIYQKCIRGRLDYDQMVHAYKRYRVFLNVNSVKQSPTMFSRRVFELLACGTPVITTYSRGIVELLGEDVVFFTESESDTRRHLEYLLEDDESWARASVRGIRKVMREHTYRHRLHDICQRVGITMPESRQPRISVVAVVKSTAEAESLAQQMAAQTYREFDLLVLTESEMGSDSVQVLRNAISDVAVTNIVQGPRLLDRCRKASSTQILAFVDVRDSYGPDYLMDYAAALMYSGADFLGKHSFLDVGASGEERLQNPGHEYQYVSSVQAATLIAKKNALSETQFERALKDRIFADENGRILSIDRFSYCENSVSRKLTEANRADNSVRQIEIAT